MGTVILTYLTFAALIGTAVTIVLGVFNLFRASDAKRSNKMMRLRVMFQGLALIMFALMLWYGRG